MISFIVHDYVVIADHGWMNTKFGMKPSIKLSLVLLIRSIMKLYKSVGSIKSLHFSCESFEDT